LGSLSLKFYIHLQKHSIRRSFWTKTSRDVIFKWDDIYKLNHPQFVLSVLNLFCPTNIVKPKFMINDFELTFM